MAAGTESQHIPSGLSKGQVFRLLYYCKASSDKFTGMQFDLQ